MGGFAVHSPEVMFSLNLIVDHNTEHMLGEILSYLGIYFPKNDVQLISIETS